ncbi:hypothetical protein V1290_002370 [Bradyrhizobium sp. AZCC 1578]|uniref:hypothetical protein n=1 Tax=Bradyrhizobium sp. AZCC 1578 TaxID=3117027 RepID=UPI002FF24AC8
MKKIGVFLVFLPAAVAAAALFGMIHDQISYSVSPEYYTKFKFIQFRVIDLHVPDRIRFAIVGFRASWWMGIPLGILCGWPANEAVRAAFSRATRLPKCHSRR